VAYDAQSIGELCGSNGLFGGQLFDSNGFNVIVRADNCATRERLKRNEGRPVDAQVSQAPSSAPEKRQDNYHIVSKASAHVAYHTFTFTTKVNQKH